MTEGGKFAHLRRLRNAYEAISFCYVGRATLVYFVMADNLAVGIALLGSFHSLEGAQLRHDELKKLTAKKVKGANA